MRGGSSRRLSELPIRTNFATFRVNLNQEHGERGRRRIDCEAVWEAESARECANNLRMGTRGKQEKSATRPLIIDGV